MNRFQTNFLSNDSGAVTVDWVVLTAALVGLGLATMSVVSSGVEDVSGDIDSQLGQDHIIRTSFNYIPSFASIGMMNGFATGGACSQLPDGSTSCTPGYSEMTARYNMSDGTEWRQVTHTVDGQQPTVTWLDGDGDEVAAGDVPDIPDDLPSAF